MPPQCYYYFLPQKKKSLGLFQWYNVSTTFREILSICSEVNMTYIQRGDLLLLFAL
jgi:hypothetical protein